MNPTCKAFALFFNTFPSFANLAAFPNPGIAVARSNPKFIAREPASPQSKPSLDTSAANVERLDPAPATDAAAPP